MKKIVGLMIVIALAAGSLVSPESNMPRGQERKQQVIQHDTAAIVKLVAVRVLDESGRPVMDLSKEDFVLSDNGQRMTVTEFEVHRLTSETIVADPEARPAAAPIVQGGLNRKIFLFLDLQGSDVNGVVNAKQAVYNFLDTKLQPADEVALIGFSPMRGFIVQEYLTTDHAKIRRAVKKMREVPPSSGSFVEIVPDEASRVQAGDVVDGILVSGGDRSTGDLSEPAGGYLGRTGERSLSLSSELPSVFVPGTNAFQHGDFVPLFSDLAEVMKHIPGNKSLVLFSGRDLGPWGTALGRDFADAGTPVYAVNTKNWIMRGFFTSVKVPHIYEEHSLKDLSLASGGEYFADVKDIETISQDVQALTGNYYVLGYYIKEDWDGRFHKIDVGVQRSELRVLTQAGYYSPRPFAEMSDFEKKLHLFDLIFSEGRVLGDAPEIPVGALDIAMSGGHDGIILLELAVDPKSGISPSKVELFAFIRDEDQVPIVSRKWDFDLSKYDGQMLVLCLCSPFKSGEYDGRVVVRDIVTGRSSVGRSVFNVGALPEEAIIVSSPVILVPGTNTKIANLPLGGKRRGGPAERNFIHHYPFIPRGHRIVVREIDYGTEHIQVVVPIRLKVADQQNLPRLQFTARFVPPAGGDGMPLEVKVIDAQSMKDGREFRIMDISLPDTARGECELVITATDIDTEKSASVKTALVIK